jgi:hypothetical protein
MITLILSFLSVTVLAIEHDDIITQMSKPVAPMEVMNAAPEAKSIPLNKLFNAADKKKAKKEKVPFIEASPKPTSFFDLLTPIRPVYAFSPAQPSPTPIAKGIDLRSKDCPVVNQFGGTCTAHGLAAAMENLNECKVNLAERHLWFTYQQYNVYPAIDAAKKNKITTQEIWPNSSEKPKGVLTQNKGTTLRRVNSLGGDVRRAVQSLDTKNPVYAAVNTPIDMSACMPVIREQTKANQEMGHAFAIVGYKLDERLPSKGYFIVKNSWGDKCGDKGYQYLPFSYCSRQDTYCLLFSVEETQTL